MYIFSSQTVSAKPAQVQLCEQNAIKLRLIISMNENNDYYTIVVADKMNKMVSVGTS